MAGSVIRTHGRNQRKHSVEAWAERHRLEGHHPYPAPTAREPGEDGECKCDPDAPWVSVWRILTPDQIQPEVIAHLGRAAKARREGRRLPEDDPAWQEQIRQAKQRVAERSQETQ